MDPVTPYPPLARAPLRLGGMFGIAWQLYKRGFWQMFFVSFLLTGLPVLLVMLSYFSMLRHILPDILNSLSAGGGFERLGALLSSLLFMGVAMLLFSFLLGPMYQGTVYLEMEERMEGRAGTLGQLFRCAIPMGLKRFYTTFLALFVLQLGIRMVASFIGSLGAVGTIFSALPALGDSPSTSMLTSGFGSLGITTLLELLVALCAGAFLALIYPIAAHERKFAFSAVGRSFQLTAKHFWRILGATLLFSLVAGTISGIICLFSLFLLQNYTAMFVLLAVLLAFAVALVAPYSAAFHTALYVDIAARVDGPELSVIDPDSVPDPDPDELRDGPRTL